MTRKCPSYYVGFLPPSEHYQLYVPESAQVGSAVGKIKANDADTGSNADMKYTIINGDGSGVFSISTDKETREGILSLKKVSHRRCKIWVKILLLSLDYLNLDIESLSLAMNV